MTHHTDVTVVKVPKQMTHHTDVTVVKVPKSNRKMIERDKIYTPTHKYVTV